MLFGEYINLPMLFIMLGAMILSSIFISIEKKNVEKEEISVHNGYIHTKIVLVLTIGVGCLEYLFNL